MSRKAILKEQRAKMGGGEAPAEGGGEAGGGVTFEGGHERADEPSSEPNFNRDGERRVREQVEQAYWHPRRPAALARASS